MSAKAELLVRFYHDLVALCLVAVIVAFVLCWAPFHAQRLMTVYIPDDQWTPQLLYIESQLFYISGRKLLWLFAVALAGAAPEVFIWGLFLLSGGLWDGSLPVGSRSEA